MISETGCEQKILIHLMHDMKGDNFCQQRRITTNSHFFRVSYSGIGFDLSSGHARCAHISCALKRRDWVAC